ncbi:MAG: Pseudouridine-5'-phosphate glycosidase [Alphaproteobacteria bacterium MarineAlpha2_Bin1]|nr:MAG: Pseudouridine-5'-phosphate glycosidase [Alphaproteobacteria bacterium MarineAlpha2_Bin1]
MFPIKISPEVNYALNNNQPIVAIESTIFAHGLPYPANIECAQEIKNIIKKNGATPAIIILDNGFINIGCNNDQLNKISTSQNIEKVSTREISTILVSKKCGATTVAGTIVCATAAKINIMVTGGIGGIHSNFNNSHDMSTDLFELSRNKVSVVCSGIKSILDIPKTLEHLETLGIPIIGYKSNIFPSFYSSDSGFYNTYNAKTYDEIALIINYHKSVKGGIIITNPPPEKYSIDNNKINKWTKIASQEAESMNISGKKLTPFILKRLREMSENKTLKTNIELIYDNAKIASQIAVSQKKI